MQPVTYLQLEILSPKNSPTLHPPLNPKHVIIVGFVCSATNPVLKQLIDTNAVISLNLLNANYTWAETDWAQAQKKVTKY